MALSGFLALTDELADYAKARFAVLPIPYDATTSYQAGTRNGPEAILSASRVLEEMDEELFVETYRHGIVTMSPVTVDVSGPEAMHRNILEAARRIVADGKFLLGLGGDHSVTSALYKAHAERYGKLSMLQIDAHLDLRDAYEHSPYSHASVMRRVLEAGVESIVPVGIRNVCAEELALVREQKINMVTARSCRDSNDWIETVVDALSDSVYVSVDIDGFDPAFAPGTGTPEPGGLDWYQVTDLLRAVSCRKKIVGADIVEVMPIPGQNVTEFLAARLAYKIMTYVSADQQEAG